MMAEIDQDFEGDHGSTATTTNFSHLLFGDVDDDDDEIMGLHLGGQSFNNVCSFFPAHEKTPKILCFGDRHQTDHAEVVFGESAINTTKPATTTRQKSGLTCSDSSSISSDNNSSKSNRNNNGARESMQCMGAIVAPQPASQRANKKSKVESPVTSTGQARLRKEKLGEGITALQQLVSPFGKTDTASVLHEAMGYIRFLHDQVQVLSSPYLQHLPDDRGEESRKDLKSRGLCLVPVACTLHVENGNNGADFWSPAAMGKKNNEIKQ